MVCARIADDGEGTFTAHVEFDQTQPFCFLRGPERVTVEEAVAWGRAHAAEVVVRIGNEHYTAGTDSAPNMLVLDVTDIAPADSGPDEPVRWRATARTGWWREDLESVAAAFADALRGHQVVANVVVDVEGHAFVTSFELTAPSQLAANETAFDAARQAWGTVQVHATAGEDFDVSMFEVVASGPPRG